MGQAHTVEVQPGGEMLKPELFQDVSILFYSNIIIIIIFRDVLLCQSTKQPHAWNICLWCTRSFLGFHGTALLIWLEPVWFIQLEALVECLLRVWPMAAKVCRKICPKICCPAVSYPIYQWQQLGIMCFCFLKCTTKELKIEIIYSSGHIFSWLS